MKGSTIIGEALIAQALAAGRRAVDGLDREILAAEAAADRANAALEELLRQLDARVAEARLAHDELVAENLALARALGGVAAAVKGYRWIPAGEWGPFPEGKRTARTLRREASECFAEVLRIVDEALRTSAARLDAEAQGGRRG